MGGIMSTMLVNQLIEENKQSGFSLIRKFP